jgi:hypothetical protein
LLQIRLSGYGQYQAWNQTEENVKEKVKSKKEKVKRKNVVYGVKQELITFMPKRS